MATDSKPLALATEIPVSNPVDKRAAAIKAWCDVATIEEKTVVAHQYPFLAEVYSLAGQLLKK